MKPYKIGEKLKMAENLSNMIYSDKVRSLAGKYVTIRAVGTSKYSKKEFIYLIKDDDNMDCEIQFEHNDFEL